MLDKPGIVVASICLLLVILAVVSDSPPRAVGADAPDSVFSAVRAFRFVEEICQQPHSTGTEENKRVREYIAGQCRQFGLETEIQHAIAVSRRGNSFQTNSNIYSANVYNVVARLKGKRGNGKALLVMSHFDTQPNAPGAGDDGAGVAAMLETARILGSTSASLENDVIFLFTDAEELGMLGAAGFVQDSTRSREVGLVMNFDNRGSGGTATMFEVNSQNGWAVNHFKRAAQYPIGNSLGYEIYKLLPNDTDYTMFRRAGISGLNFGFIDGFVDYHSPTDKPAQLDLGSLQQHGGNMLSLVRYFGNIPLEETKAEDVAFFNVAGFWMVSHPASWNTGFVTLCALLVVAFTAISWRKGLITIKGFAIGFLVFLITSVVLFFATTLLIGGILKLYPEYKQFYGNNSYNAASYHLAFVALSVLIFSIAYRWLLKKVSMHALFSAILVIEAGLVALLYPLMPTAIFILVFPLIFCAAGNIALHYVENTTLKGVIMATSLLPALWWLPSAISQMYVVFGLSPEAGGMAVLIGLLLGMMLPVFSQLFTDSRSLAARASLALVVCALVAGHLRSGFSSEKPMQTYLSYQVRADEGKAYWGTTLLDDWNRQFFPDPVREERRILNETPLLSYAPPALTILADSVIENVRHLHLRCSARDEAITMRVDFARENPALDVIIEGPAETYGNIDRGTGEFFAVHYAGLDSAGFDLKIKTSPDKPFALTLTDRSLGLPEGAAPYPGHIVPGTGYNANTVQVTARFQLPVSGNR